MKIVVVKFGILVMSVLGGLLACSAFAEKLPSKGEAALRATLSDRFGITIAPDHLSFASEIGLYRLQLENAGRITTYYVSSNGRYVIRGGKLFDIAGDRPIDLDQKARIDLLGDSVNQLVFHAKPSQLLTYKGNPKGKYHGRVAYVFSDPFCPYCQKFHLEALPKMTDAGITVHYFPLPIIRTKRSLPTTTTVWCEKNLKKRKQLWEEAVKNKRVYKGDEKCQKLIQSYTELGLGLGAEGTPFILLDNLATFNGLPHMNALFDSLSQLAPKSSKTPSKKAK